MVVRNPDYTRESLLRAGFDEIYQNGFMSARVDRILDHTNVTKGAFYHHFPTKRALGEAVLAEVIRPLVLEVWIEPVEAADDPLAELTKLVDGLGAKVISGEIAAGCPLNNLAQELSAVDEDFRLQVQEVFEVWQDRLAATLERARKRGLLRQDVEVGEAALFIIAAIEGGICLAKSSRNERSIRTFSRGLSAYLEGLRS